MRVVVFQPVLKLVNGLEIQLLPHRLLTKKDVVSGLVWFGTAWTVWRRLPFGYFMLKVSNGAAACDVLGVENAIHSQPHSHCPLQSVPIDSVEVFLVQF